MRSTTTGEKKRQFGSKHGGARARMQQKLMEVVIIFWLTPQTTHRHIARYNIWSEAYMLRVLLRQRICFAQIDSRHLETNARLYIHRMCVHNMHGWCPGAGRHIAANLRHIGVFLFLSLTCTRWFDFGSNFLVHFTIVVHLMFRPIFLLCVRTRCANILVLYIYMFMFAPFKF